MNKGKGLCSEASAKVDPSEGVAAALEQLVSAGTPEPAIIADLRKAALAEKANAAVWTQRMFKVKSPLPGSHST